MPSILIAESAAPVAAAVRKFLEGDGLDLVVVSTLDEARRELREHPPTVLITSLSPTLDGEQLCRQVKQERPALPVLLLYMPEEEHPEARSAVAGADGCLVGPLKRTTVLTCVRLLVKLAAAWSAGPSEMPVIEAQPDELDETDFGSLEEDGPPAPPPAPQQAAPQQAAPQQAAPQEAAPQEPVAQAPEPPPEAHEPEARPAVVTRHAEPAPSSSPDFEFLKRLLLMEVKRSRRYRYPIALLLIELDRFTERAAPLTAAQRTASLAETLKLLVSGVRDIDVAVPVSEGRFVVFLPHTGQDGGMVVAERLRQKVKDQHPVPGMTTAVGLAVFDPGAGRPKDQTQVSFGNLMKEAGEALRKAQSAGGDRVESHQPRGASQSDRISMG
jgi:diguanylate cyclase (GGDEF)-like protein